MQQMADRSPLIRFAWPERRPELDLPDLPRERMGDGAREILACDLSPLTRLVVQLGSGLGLKTRYIADRAPNAVVIAVDHWQGGPGHQREPEGGVVPPAPYETFLAACWSYRDRIAPLRMSGLEGLRAIADHGLEPNLIYIDGDRSSEIISVELDAALQLFPKAIVVGNDHGRASLNELVADVANRRGVRVETHGVQARAWKVAMDTRCSSPSGPPANAMHAPDVGREPPGSAPCVPVRAPRTTLAPAVDGPRRAVDVTGPTLDRPGIEGAVVLVPHLDGIDEACERGLRGLESSGVRVVRARGFSQIDVGRNEMASEAIHNGARAILFIDADIGFEPSDALRLLARPEPVVAGVYPKKGRREMASRFAEGIREVVFGEGAPGLYPLKYAAAGFLRVRVEILRRMIEVLRLPLCNTPWGRGVWPFFQPLIIPLDAGTFHYLGEDWAFCHRLRQIGVTPMADTSIRLWHYGRHAFGWEDAGSEPSRYGQYTYHIE